MKEISIGTYSIKGDVGEVIGSAVLNNFRLFDAAPNYCHGKAHSFINSVAASSSSDINRDPVSVTTKIGYLPHGKITDLIQEEVILPEEVFEQNCLSKKYVAYQLKKNLQDLDNVCVEAILLHNPETQAKHLSPRDFAERLTQTFEILETAVEEGKIKEYGVATWHGFNNGLLNIRDLLDIAHTVAGSNHHFNVIQMPVSMVNIHPLYEAHCFKRGILLEARELGLKIQGSSPLHRGELPKIVSLDLANLVLENSSPAIACYLFAISSPYIDRMLTSPSKINQLEDLRKLQECSLIDTEKLEFIIKVLMKHND